MTYKVSSGTLSLYSLTTHADTPFLLCVADDELYLYFLYLHVYATDFVSYRVAYIHTYNKRHQQKYTPRQSYLLTYLLTCSVYYAASNVVQKQLKGLRFCSGHTKTLGNQRHIV